MLKVLVNLYYLPTKQLKLIITSNDMYIAINGGASLKNDKWCQKHIIMDDTGDNISSYNKLLNEMTSIYWGWKHYYEIGNPEYIGFNHYRRFFTDIDDYYKYDLIVSKPIFSSNTISLAQLYNYYHCILDLLICINLLISQHLQFGEDFYKYLVSQGTNYAPCNMFIMRKDLFFEWCNFIFPILFNLLKLINVEGRDNYQKRAICFLTERIFGFWVYQRMDKLKVKQIDIVEYLNFKPDKINERGDFSK